MKDRIISESIESLRREGLRFSVDTLAERLNISKKTVYKYFSNKEALALALYQKYYADIKAKADLLIGENTAAAHKELLNLYYDAKMMTRSDIFNKYKLNDVITSFTSRQNDELLNNILTSADSCRSKSDREALRIIADGAFEKLCNEKIAPDGVLDRLAELLW